MALRLFGVPPAGPRPALTSLQLERAKYGGRSPVCTSEWQRYRRRVLPVLLELQDYRCALCGAAIDPEAPGNSAAGATIDHVTPLHAGGELIPVDDFELRVVHRACNSARSNATRPRIGRRRLDVCDS